MEPDKKLFSTEEAAAFLGISVATMKYHVHVAKNIAGHKVGHSLVFMREELETFQANRRPPGRPPKKEKNEAS